MDDFLGVGANRHEGGRGGGGGWVKADEGKKWMRRVMYSVAQEPQERLFTRKCDSIDGVEEPFVAIGDPRDGSTRRTREGS